MDKTRLSVNGWFHGPPAPRAELPIAKPLPLAPPNNLSVSWPVLHKWCIVKQTGLGEC